MTEQKLIQVRNLVDHNVVIPDPEAHRRYSFQPYEVKKIDEETLRRLSYRYGVLYMFKNCLCVEDDELAREFGVAEDSLEHEYKWTQTDIDNCLLNGTVEELLDALDFAPEGIVDTLVQRAIDLKINDVSKRKAILDKTGKNIDSMIQLVEQYNAATGVEEEKPKTRQRRASGAKKQNSGRRVQE